ncbi:MULTISPECIES: YgaP family membrane protein [Kyrpidia]|nr:MULTISPECIES: DUF2892 domain-containing protein [Kyrpidia]
MDMFVESGKGSLIRIVAGVFILIGAGLSLWVHPHWVYFDAFVGLMLIISALTGFCPMYYILRALGIKDAQCTVRRVGR